jgi:hypothetical protein
MHLLALSLQRQVTLPVPARRQNSSITGTQHSIAGMMLDPMLLEFLQRKALRAAHKSKHKPNASHTVRYNLTAAASGPA